MFRRIVFIGFIFFMVFQASSQRDSIKNVKWDVSGTALVRSMLTDNRGELEDFYVTIALANLGLSYQVTPWLKFSGSVYGSTHLGLSGIKKLDKTTLNGSIYEHNLWNLIWFENDVHVALPELNAQVELGQHQLTVGRFLFKSPFFNPEIWSFKNAAEGLRYVYRQPQGNLRVESEFIHRISTRFDARYQGVGESFGRGGIGFGFDGKRSKYTGNIDSDYMVMLGADWRVSPTINVIFWNQYVDNVMNNLFVEPKFTGLNGWSASVMFIQQFKINDGGNVDEELTYLRDKKSAYFGLRLSKLRGKNLFQLNFSRVLDQGRLQLTRDWAIEPFYTLQRRTRIEGTRNTTVLMFKWQQQWKNNHGQFRWFSSVSRAWMPFPGDYEKSKYRLPSNAHVDFAFKYAPNSFIKGLSAEIYLAYRFLAEDIGTEYRYLINRADFFHTDLVVSYNF